jgi:hypothetical protein
MRLHKLPFVHAILELAPKRRIERRTSRGRELDHETVRI